MAYYIMDEYRHHLAVVFYTIHTRSMVILRSSYTDSYDGPAGVSDS